MARTAPTWFVIAVASLLARPADGCYYDYRPDLWAGLESADLVVVAEVQTVEPAIWEWVLGLAGYQLATTAELVGKVWWDGQVLLEEIAEALPLGGRTVIEARVVETLVGEAPAGEALERLRLVEDTGGYVQPGERLLMFLKRRPLGWRLPFGIFSLHRLGPAEDLGDLRLAVSSAEAMMAHGSPTPEALREWLVLAAALPNTRALALPRLRREGGLSNDHAELLAGVFVAESFAVDELEDWLTLFADHPNARVDEHATAIVETARALRPDYGWQDGARAVLRRLGLNPAKPSCPTDEDKRRFRELWDGVVRREWPGVAARR